jgi:serine/threonine protein kinase
MRECPACRQCFPDEVEQCPNDNQPTKQSSPIENLVAGRYLLQHRIGEGSVSVVYSAHDQQNNNTVAVKIIPPDLIGNDSLVRNSFLAEARAAAALRHPNIVAIMEVGVANEVIPFIVMEFVSGSSLKEILAKQGALSPAEAGEYVSAIAAGLGSAHESGVVHGDLKPRNILVKTDLPVAEGVRILDFGMAGIKAGRLKGAGVNKRGGMLRSAHYLAPEEWSDDEEPQPASDIYSLAVILYQMLTGVLPFKGSNSVIMKQHLMNTPPPLVGTAGPISTELEGVVLRALSKEPEQRPATMLEFASDIKAAVEKAAPGVSKRRKTSTRPITTAASSTTRSTRARKPAVTTPKENVPDPDADVEPLTFDGFATLVHPRVAKQTPPEKATKDLGQTIVLPAKRASSQLEQTIVLKKESVDSRLQKAPQPTPPAQPHIEPVEDTSVGSFIPEEVAPEPTDDYEKLDSVEDSYDGDVVPVPRSIPPWLLALGVALVIILIGIGVYFSRQAE